MTPLAYFDAVWARCAQLARLYAYLRKNVAGIMPLDELLRSQWATRVSALDLYIHELVAQRMLAIFGGYLPNTPAYDRFQISNETLYRIRNAALPSDAEAAFDLDVRGQLSRITFQDPDSIADGVRLCSSAELWNEVALKLGATAATRALHAKTIKRDLSLIVQRRNKIVHEGDLQPLLPRDPWPVAESDLVFVTNRIEAVVRAIDSVV